MGCIEENEDLREQVRLLITDLDIDNPIFTNAQIDGFISLASREPRRAAARALRTIAASEVLISKKITTQDLSTDGPAVSAELRALADALDAEALEAENAGGLAWWIEGSTGLEHCEGEEWRL